MKINDLELKANKNRKRAGRGHAAGQGKTAGRGHKGQNARSGGKSKRGAGFEGGQNPLVKRIPHLRGFKSHKMPKATVSTDAFERIDGKAVTIETVKKAGLISPHYSHYKVVLGTGKIAKAYNVDAHAISAKALSAVEKAGGKYTETAFPVKEKVAKSDKIKAGNKKNTRKGKKQ